MKFLKKLHPTKKALFILGLICAISGIGWMARNVSSNFDKKEILDFFDGSGKPAGRHREDDGDHDEDYPHLWQKMFMRGRQARDGRPASAHLLQAKTQARLLPLARPGGNFLSLGLKPLPGAPPPGPSCDWTEMGPSPEDDSVDSTTAYLYGNVSGRVTSLVLDPGDPNILYVGTAYGGVWKTTNGLSGSPTFTPISDPAQSLAVGAIAMGINGPTTTFYVGSGELNMDGDSYYGVGIFTSNDGSSWTLVPTANSGAISFAGLACSKILVDPTGPATVMAAMGFACCHPGLTNLNQGLYRSTDSGANWNQVTTVNGGGQAINGHSFTDIVYDGSATFFAAVRFQGVYFSTDHGASWTQRTSPFASGVTANTTNFARATLASRGATLWCLAADANDEPATAASGDTGLSQSTDGGNTWTAVHLPLNLPNWSSGWNLFAEGAGPQGTYDQYVAAPPGTSTLLIGGIDALKASLPVAGAGSWTDMTQAYTGAATFVHPSHPDQHAYAFANAVTWYIGNDGGVWLTTNSGNSFSNLNTDLGTIQFYSVSPDPSAAGKFVGGSQDNGTSLNHSNSGLTWAQLDGGDGGYTDASPSVLGQFYDENFGIGLFRSDNYGVDNFPNIVIDTSYSGIKNDSANILVPYQVLSGSPVSVILGTSRVWKGPGIPGSDGNGWNPIGTYLDSTSGNILAIAAAPSNTSYIYATTVNNPVLATPAYHVFTNNGGSTWSNITGTIPTGSPIQGLAVDPTNPATVYVGVQGFVGSTGSGHLFQTTNSGGSWTDITGNLPDVPVNWIVVDPHFPSDVYVATDVGVFATQNVNGASTSWARLGTTLPDSTVLQIKMSSTCPRALVAATHGRGAWSICPLSSYFCPTSTPTPTPTSTFTPTITPTPGPSFSAQAWPNTTDGKTPIQFKVNLIQPGTILMGIYDIAGEAVYATSAQGVVGWNTLNWNVQNQYGEPIASGIYLYFIEVNGDKKLGKIYVHH